MSTEALLIEPSSGLPIEAIATTSSETTLSYSEYNNVMNGNTQWSLLGLPLLIVTTLLVLYTILSAKGRLFISARARATRRGKRDKFLCIPCGGSSSSSDTEEDEDEDYELASPSKNGEKKNNNRRPHKLTSWRPHKLTSWYMNQLNTHELRTKCWTSAILAAFGDVCAQFMETSLNIAAAAANNSNNDIIGGGGVVLVVEGGKSVLFDTRRLLAMTIDGCVTTGPLLHYVYELYEWVLPTEDKEDENEGGGGGDCDNDTVMTIEIEDDIYSTAIIQQQDEEKLTINNNKKDKSKKKKKELSSKQKFLNTTAHVLFDNFVMTLICYIPILIVFTGLLEGYDAHAIMKELRTELIPSLKVSYRVSFVWIFTRAVIGISFFTHEVTCVGCECFRCYLGDCYELGYSS